MKKFTLNFSLLLVVLLLLVACGGDEAEDSGPADGGEVGPGMMDDDNGMMGVDGDLMSDSDEMMGDDANTMGEDEGMMGEESSGMGEGGMGGTAWGDGAFTGNGERIYFTGSSERSGDIDYTGGPDSGGMMMGGQLACASCHGPDARGGRHQMHMETMDAPNIRWVALASHGSDSENEHAGEEEDEHADGEGEYSLETFRLAVVAGQHPTGEPLSEEMPRWAMSDADLRDLAAYLQTFEGE